MRKENDCYRPAFWVQFTKELSDLTPKQKAEYDRLTAMAVELLKSLYNVCREVILAEVPAFLREDEHQINHAVSNIMSPRGAVMLEALDSGWLTYDENDPASAKRRMLGAFLVIE